MWAGSYGELVRTSGISGTPTTKALDKTKIEKIVKHPLFFLSLLLFKMLFGSQMMVAIVGSQSFIIAMR
jgi:hypothetical protein